MCCQWATRYRWCLIVIRLKYVQAFEFLVEHGERLETPCFLHLQFEPIFHLILSVIFQILVDIIEMPMDNVNLWYTLGTSLKRRVEDTCLIVAESPT